MVATRSLLFIVLALAVLCAVDAQGRNRPRNGRRNGNSRRPNQNGGNGGRGPNNNNAGPGAGNRSPESDSDSLSSSSEDRGGPRPGAVCYLSANGEVLDNVPRWPEEIEGEENPPPMLRCDREEQVEFFDADGNPYFIAFFKPASDFYAIALAEKGSQPCDPDNVDGHPCFGPFTIDNEEDPMFFCGEYDDFGAESIERCRPERDSSSSSSSTEDVTEEEEAAGGDGDGEGEGEEAGGPDGGEMGGEQPPP